MDTTRGHPPKYSSTGPEQSTMEEEEQEDGFDLATPATSTPRDPENDELEKFRREWKQEVQTREPNPQPGPSQQQQQQQPQEQDQEQAPEEEDEEQSPPIPEAEIYGPAALKYSKGAHKLPRPSQPPTIPDLTPERSSFGQRISESDIPFSSSEGSGRPLAPKETIAGPSTQPPAHASEATQQSIKNAVEAYAHAVEMERSGQLDQALVSYRRAFKLNTNADRLYHRAQVLLTDPAASSSQSDALLASPAVASSVKASLDFDDHRYVAIKERQAREETARPAPELKSSVPIDNRPDELAKLLAKLSVERDFSQVGFEPEDDESEVLLARLPDEVLLHVLWMVVQPRGKRGAKINRPKPTPDELAARASGEKKEPAAPPPPAEETPKQPKHVGIGVVLGGPDWKSLEIIGRTCWKLRLLTKAPTLWKEIVKETYYPPLIDARTSLSDLHRLYHYDWRTVFVNQPRVRLNGCYIAACHYARPGMSEESAWIRVVHVVEFYRSVRFLPDGRCLSLLTTDPPSETVRKLEPSLRAKGFATGRWELFPNGLEDDEWEQRPPGPKVVVEDLRDRTMQKYAFRMVFGFRQTHRGKWNKLDLLDYFSVNLTNGEVLPLPQKHSRPFHFSCVLPYGV